MEHAKLAKGSGHKPIGRSSVSAPKKADRKVAKPLRSLRKERVSKSKTDKLGCRYCGSDGSEFHQAARCGKWRRLVPSPILAPFQQFRVERSQWNAKQLEVRELA